jgi:Zn-dependent protease with chaperone function
MEPVTDYISMLKYGDAARFGGRYPDPYTALRIPAKAADEPRVSTIYDQILNHSVSFVLLHEMGHVLYQHPGYGPGVSRARARENEDEADRFALEVLRRVGQPVSGLLFFFLSAAHAVPHRADFGSDAEYQAHLAQATHPLTSQRITRLAQYLREPAAD